MPTTRRASLFLTCSADTLYPRVGRAAVRVLENYGVDVDFPAEQTCCGQPWLNTGDTKNAKALAMNFLNVFGQAEAIVAPSSSCVDTVRNRYPPLFNGEPRLQDRFRELAAKTYEICEYLHRILEIPALPPHPEPTRTTYHSSCRTLRGIGLSGVAESYLKQMLGDNFVALPDADTCCGFGGSFSVKFPEVSGKMMAEKLGNIVLTGCSTVAALDMSCLTHLAAGARRQKLGSLRFVHLAELMLAALEGKTR
jgi:L-lactate dehydrogenase complex protein LldE